MRTHCGPRLWARHRSRTHVRRRAGDGRLGVPSDGIVARRRVSRSSRIRPAQLRTGTPRPNPQGSRLGALLARCPAPRALRAAIRAARHRRMPVTADWQSLPLQARNWAANGGCVASTEEPRLRAALTCRHRFWTSQNWATARLRLDRCSQEAANAGGSATRERASDSESGHPTPRWSAGFV